MVSWHYMLIAALVAICIVAWFFVLPLRLIYLRCIAKDYNRYVYQQYTQNDKPTPAFIGRIQYDNIRKYNEFRDMGYLLKIFFKPLPILGEEPVHDDLLQRGAPLIYKQKD